MGSTAEGRLDALNLRSYVIIETTLIQRNQSVRLTYYCLSHIRDNTSRRQTSCFCNEDISSKQVEDAKMYRRDYRNWRAMKPAIRTACKSSTESSREQESGKNERMIQPLLHNNRAFWFLSSLLHFQSTILMTRATRQGKQKNKTHIISSSFGM